MITGIRLFWADGLRPLKEGAGGQNRDWDPQGSGPARFTSSRYQVSRKKDISKMRRWCQF